MELWIPTSFLQTVSITSPCPCASQCHFNAYVLRRHKKLSRRLSCHSKPIRITLSLNKDSSERQNVREDSGNIREDPEFVEVIGLGSRKEPVIDFCLDSPSRSANLRFWNILSKDSEVVQLQQRICGKDATSRVVEAPSLLQSSSKAIILVVGAAYGLDHTRALEILNTVKSGNCLIVCIILKPFSFEGRRRQDQVKDMVGKLQAATDFCIMVDTDTLLQKDMVTLDEALKTANSAVLMAINAISILISDIHIKVLDIPDENTKVLKVSELKKTFGNYKDAKVGFGAGRNIKTSIKCAIYDCPFVGVGVKDCETILVSILAGSEFIDNLDLHAALRSFRQTTECKGAIVISIVHDPNLESNLIITTVITLGYSESDTSQQGGIFSRLVQNFPLIFNFLGMHQSQSNETRENGSQSLSKVMKSADSGEMPCRTQVNGYLRDYDSSSERSEVDHFEANSNTYTSYDKSSEGEPIFPKETLNRQNIASGYQVAPEWTSEGASEPGATPVLNNLSIYRLPVGVKPSEEFEESSTTSNSVHQSDKIANGVMKIEPQIPLSMPWDALTDASFEAIMEFYNNASSLLKGSYEEDNKKQGVLSIRAASMLQVERDSRKKWSRIVNIKYRGGLYVGHCQGGLPEGKGRLSDGDGNIYDGMWRYGKKSGLGTFYFRNGDVFRGSWRDDAMHGKGWLYFHTGDRWFVNFWKGKANGEGRFYSTNGDVIFGHFKDGWRHGNFLCMKINGTRCLEVWDEGVLVSRKQLDSDARAG